MCTYEEIITALPPEFRSNLSGGSKRSNPIKVEGENSYVVVNSLIFKALNAVTT